MWQKKWCVVLCGILLSLICTGGVAQQIEAKDIVGTYLAGGVSSLLQIDSGVLNYRAKTLYNPEPMLSAETANIKVIADRDSLTLIYGKEGESIQVELKYKPSPKVAGDWDLVGMLYSGYTPTSDTEILQKGVTLKTPLSSYLHRVNDRRVADYYATISNKGGYKSDLSKAIALLKDFPDDPYIRAIYLDALMRNEKWDELSEKHNLWRSDLEKSGNPFLSRIPRFMERGIAARRLSAEHQNAADYLCPMDGQNLKEPTESLIDKVFACRGYILPVFPPTMGFEPPIPNFLSAQIQTKVLRTEAVFAMLKGDNERALHILNMTYRLGQIFCGRTNLISTLIGIALKSITCGGMEIYLANACRTPEEVKTFFETLRTLRVTDEKLHWDDYRYLDAPLREAQDEADMGTNYSEAITRWDTAETKSRLLLAGAAARYNFLKTGEFPREASGFAPLLPDGLPQDPFTGTPLCFIGNRDPFVVYSVGPDKEDDKAAFLYDPTNGTFSPGDVFIEIPRKPRYPFPPKGQLATTKEELLKQFPNNLPPDSFHDVKGAPLSITDTVPAKIISFGPDTDSARVRPDGTGLLPLQPAYDPTTGTVSPG
ncbi:MAG: hypothetical protein NT106_03090, partial [Candidatus Sumerlaeota bacterium]|nr:hypothetical protein [Candidatus Sumerlaeota bacterium]